ncbi:glycosyltransferase [Actinomycetospora aeridis]|uniref:Glycosyltransferase n=1 Tax=Actinomycetospora aeridis TaxID=3129231 RepID=A0ABU8NB14_9PSEU
MPEGTDACRHPGRRGPDSLVRVLLPLVAVVATVPAPLAAPVLGAGAPPELLLAGGAVVLAGVGLTAAGTWRLLAAGARAVPAASLLGAAVMLGEGVAIGGELAPDGSPGLLVGAAGGAVAGAGLLGVLGRWWHRSRSGAPAPRTRRRPLVAAVALLVLLVATRGSVTAWLVALGVVGVVVAGLPLLVRHVRAGTPRAALVVDPVVRPTADAPAPAPEDDPYATIEVGPPAAPARAAAWAPTLRILHLGGADPDAAAELHRRLAVAGHEITVLSPRRSGVVDRIEHHGAGMVRWTHPVRRGWTRRGRLLAYVAAAVVAARHTRADLVVEELGTSPGPLAVPRWTSRPVVALATTLPAPEPTDRRAPLLRLRWWAVRTHRSVVVRSPAGAEALAAGRSRAHVAVVGDGIDPAALWTSPRHRDEDVVVRVGRLGLEPDAVRPLLYAWARVVSPGRLVLQGCGVHEPTLRGCAAQLGLSGQVAFAEERDGEARHARVASARVAVVAPGASDAASRAVALEALAVGTPVLGPDTAALREVVPSEVGLLVPPGADAAALADGLGALHADRARSHAAASQGPGLARAHDLDLLAGQTADVYLAAVTRRAMTRGTARVGGLVRS